MPFSRITSAIKVRIRRVKYSLLFEKCGTNLIIDDDVSITYPSNMVVGDNLTLNKRVFIQCHPSVHISIGNNVIMSYEAMILTAGPQFVLNSKHHIRKDVKIGDNVKILAKALVTSGLEIGRGAVIGSGSVVRDDIPPYAIVVGNPAKIVGFIATPDEIEQYEEKAYPPEVRIAKDELEKNYQRFFLQRLSDIKKINKL